MAFSPQALLDSVITVVQTALPTLNVWSEVPHKDVKMPFVLVSIISDIPAVYFGTATDDFKLFVQVDVYARREYGMRELRLLAESVKAVLHKKVIIVSNAGNVNGFCTRRGPARPETDNVNRIIMEFMIMGSEN